MTLTLIKTKLNLHQGLKTKTKMPPFNTLKYKHKVENSLKMTQGKIRKIVSILILSKAKLNQLQNLLLDNTLFQHQINQIEII